MSHNHILNKPILTMIKENEKDINSILDVACGYGQYGLLLRVINDYKGKIHTFDLYEPYIDRLADLSIYNYLYRKDVNHWIQTVDLSEYDLYIVGDLIEHLTREEGLRIIEKMKEAKRVIITTPNATAKNYKKRCGYWDGNDLLFHTSGFTPSDFKDYKVEVFDLMHIPRQLKLIYKIRELLTGNPIGEQEILAYRGF